MTRTPSTSTQQTPGVRGKFLFVTGSYANGRFASSSARQRSRVNEPAAAKNVHQKESFSSKSKISMHRAAVAFPKTAGPNVACDSSSHGMNRLSQTVNVATRHPLARNVWLILFPGSGLASQGSRRSRPRYRVRLPGQCAPNSLQIFTPAPASTLAHDVAKSSTSLANARRSACCRA